MSWVSVPVLSVQSTSIAPKFWMALRRFTIVLCRDIATAPLARFVVTIIGSISGVSPTATARANSSASSQSPLVRPLIRNTSGTITSMKRMRSQLTLLTPTSKAVVGRRPSSPRAIEPVAVRPPVFTTTDVAVPLTTLVPMKQMVARSNVDGAVTPAGGVSNFSTGSASPVSADWLMNRSLAPSRRTSAGTMSPAER